MLEGVAGAALAGVGAEDDVAALAFEVGVVQFVRADVVVGIAMVG